MDKRTNYQKIIADILTEVHEQLICDTTRENLLSIDHQHGQYLLISDGWEASKRFYVPIIHIEIRHDNSVWLRQENTDLEIGEELIRRGISRTDIVPAFYSPQMRQLVH